MNGFTLKGPNSGFWPGSLLEILEWDGSGADMMACYFRLPGFDCVGCSVGTSADLLMLK